MLSNVAFGKKYCQLLSDVVGQYILQWVCLKQQILHLVFALENTVYTVDCVSMFNYNQHLQKGSSFPKNCR